MAGIKLPGGWQLRPPAMPPTAFRAWAGKYGAQRGLTEFTENDEWGRPEFRATEAQDAFRHAFVFGAKYLDWISRPHMAGMDTEEAAVIQTLQMGFLNEWYASNPLKHHLMDYWNNYEGILLAREAHKIYGDKITNDIFADYVAKEVLKARENQAGKGRFVFNAEKDPRTSHIAGFDRRRLPLHGARPAIIEETFKDYFKANEGGQDGVSSTARSSFENGEVKAPISVGNHSDVSDVDDEAIQQPTNPRRLPLTPTMRRLMSGDLSALDAENRPFSPNLLRMLMGGRAHRVKGATRLDDIARPQGNRFER